MDETSERRTDRVMIAFVIVIIVGMYGLSGYYYAPEYLDDAWTLSWAWNWSNHGEVYDLAFGYLDGDGGTSLFSRTYAFVYGAVGTLTGWSRGWAMLMSTAFTLASAGLWYRIVRRLGYSRSVALAFMTVLIVTEPFFRMSRRLRVDALGMLIATLSLSLFVDRRFFMAGLAAGIGVETHPFAAVALFWSLAWLVGQGREVLQNPRTYAVYAARYIAGLAGAFGYWYALHGPYADAITELGGRAGGNTFMSHYLVQRFAFRTWPELLAVVAAFTLLATRHRLKDHPFLVPALASVVAASVALQRGNVHYMAYLYPPLILLIVVAAREIRVLRTAVVVIVVFHFVQYTWLFTQNSNYSFRDDSNLIAYSVPDWDVPVYANPNAWFVLREREYMGYGFFTRAEIAPSDWPDRFLVVETRDFVRWYAADDLADGEGHFQRREVARERRWDGSTIVVWEYARSDDAQK